MINKSNALGNRDEFILRRTGWDVLNFLGDVFLAGGLPLLLGVAMLFKSPIAGILLLLFFLRHFVYNRLDTILNIRITNENGDLYMRFAGLNWQLDKKESFLIIEDVRLFAGRGYYHVYGLVLVRNAGSKWKRFLKNRIKLHVADGFPLESRMKDIHEATGIRYLDFFEDPFGGY